MKSDTFDAQSDLELPSVETFDRGIREYAEFLGLGKAELIQLVAGKDVIDWGGGRGKFAAELELLRGHTEIPPCRSIRTVNIAYKNEAYDIYYMMREHALDAKMFLELVSEKSDAYLAVPYDHETAIGAWTRAKANRVAVNWNDPEDMAQISSASADIMISIFAFPYYTEDLPGYVEDGFWFIEKTPAATLSVFREMSRILRANGKLEMQTSINYEKWREPSLAYRREELKKILIEECGLVLQETRSSPISAGFSFTAFSLTKQK